MKFYTYGDKTRPAIMLIPGTCCHHSLFDEVVPLLSEKLYVIVVSFSGFDETEQVIYKDMDTETGMIEAYIMENHDGHLAACYGCSLGGSFAAYLVSRGKISIDHAIIGSSDMDEAEGISARFQAKLIASMMYKWIRKGGIPRWLQKINEKKIEKHPDEAEYRRKFMKSFFPPCLTGGIVKKESIYNQFYSDLVTDIGTGIQCPGTVIHVFYALKMGEKYEERYLKHFAAPDIRRKNMLHEELLFCHPKEWVDEVIDCMSQKPEDVCRVYQGRRG